MDIQSLVEAVRQDPQMAEVVEEVSMHLEQMGVSPEMLDAMARGIQQALDSSEQYPALRQQAIAQGLIDEDDLPEEYNLGYLVALLLAINEVMSHLSQSQQFKRGGLAQVAKQGRGGDTMLAHINSAEAEALRRMGGSGTINPNTGIHEFKGGLFKKVGKLLKKIAKPALAIASIVPGPWQVPALTLNAAYNASQGNWLGAGLSAFGAYAVPGGYGGFGEAGGNGISGSLGGGAGEAASTFGEGFANAANATTGAGAGIDSAAGLASKAGSGMASLGATGSGITGSLASSGGLGGLGIEGLGAPAMESLGGLGSGVTGSLADLGEAPGLLPQLDPQTMDNLKLAKNAITGGMKAYQMLNPPEPQQFSQQNTQRQMQQMGGLGMGMSTNRTFGLGGNQSRGAGYMARFRNGGLARCTCKGN